MKKNYFLLLTILISFASFGQIWTEDFDSYSENTGIEGDGSGGITNIGDYPGSVTKWTLDPTNSSLFNNTDWAKTIGGVFSFRDTDGSGGVIWESESIDISSATGSVSFQLTASNNSGGFETADFYDVYYSIDGGSFMLIQNWNSLGNATHTILGKISGVDWNSVETILQSGLSGSTLQIRVQALNNAATEQFFLDDILVFEGVAPPTVSITSPTDFEILSSGTTSVDVVFETNNTMPSDTVDITINGGTPITNVTSPYTITPTNDGDTFTVKVDLIRSAASIDFEEIDFSIAFPCDLVLGAITTTCDAQTLGVDTYTTTINYTGGGTSIYTIDTGAIGTIGGDNPTSVATGQIRIITVNEGTDFVLTIMGDASNSSCNIIRNITSPTCVPTACASVGDIIITEIMANPTVVNDGDGEWFEVYNTTGASIDMQGWIIKDQSSSNELTIATSVIIAPNGYAVFGINSNTGTNGGVTVDYMYSSLGSLNNTSMDGIIIECASTLIDQVIWGDGIFPTVVPGESLELSINHLNSTDNDLGTNWSLGTTMFSGGKGTPRFVNDFTLSAGSIEVTQFSLSPNPTSSGYVNIISNNVEQPVSVKVYSLLGKLIVNETITNRLNVSSLKTGVYIVNISQNEATVSKKLIIK